MYLMKDQKIIIYGTGLAGRYVCELLEREGVEVVGFVDKRCAEIHRCMNKPVWGIRDVIEISEKDNYTILITIKNVYDHSEIANQFLNIGFHNIIFKPYDVLQGKKGNLIESIDRAYESLINKHEIYHEHIELFEMKECRDAEDEGIIEVQEGIVKVYINATLLYANQQKNAEWDSLNFVSTFSGVEMYYALDNQRLGMQTNIFNEFIDFCSQGDVKGGFERNESWKRNMIENRSNIYGEMKKMYSLRKDFFIENCPMFEYLGCGKFRIISSGKNRISFLISQGDWYIPIQIKQEQYEKYIHIEQAKKINNLLGNNAIWCVIPHPMFYGRRVIAHNYLNTWIPIIGRYISNYVKKEIGTYDFSSVHIADYSRDDGAVSRHLRRMGCVVRRNVQDTQLCQELDKLFLFDENEFKNEDKRADICIETYYDVQCDDMNILDDNEHPRIRFVLLSGEECEKKFFSMHRQYKNIQLLFESIWDGNCVRGYVLTNGGRC